LSLVAIRPGTGLIELGLLGSTCGTHGDVACGSGCADGLQECGDGKCWNCCTDGSANGICGTKPNGLSCSRNPASAYYDADCVCGGLDEPACGPACNSGLQRCGDGVCRYCCGDGSSNGVCGFTASGTSCSWDVASPLFDADCSCGGHGQPGCGTLCNSGLQLCGDGNCWYCCGDGSSNGLCGTRPDGVTACSEDPDHFWFDTDCCGGHGEPACGDVCETGLQKCGDGNCWYCCGDGSSNGICGTRPNGITACSGDPEHFWFDTDCP
jgi:hypothetical protein